MVGKRAFAASLGLALLWISAHDGPAALALGAAPESLTVPARETRLRQTASPPDLRPLLDAAADYCDRLSRSVLDFVCRERVEEWFYPDVAPAKAWDRRARRSVVVGRRVTHNYLYDYQLVRDRKGSVRESRTLLEEDEKEVRVPDALLKTRLFWHARVVMGPLGLLSRERQAEHDFRLVREAREDGERVVVIEAVPKPGVAADHLVGTVWLRSRDAAILRIEWDPSSIDDYAGVEAAAERFQMTPRVVLTSEYALEKNGIRFPRRYTVKETYVRGGRRFQRSQIDVLYDRYKFFTVETQVIF
jgi:hypothetical protein